MFILYANKHKSPLVAPFVLTAAFAGTILIFGGGCITGFSPYNIGASEVQPLSQICKDIQSAIKPSPERPTINLGSGMEAYIHAVARQQNDVLISLTLSNKSSNTVYLMLTGPTLAQDNKGATYSFENSTGISKCPWYNDTLGCLAHSRQLLQSYTEVGPGAEAIVSFSLFGPPSKGTTMSFSTVLAVRIVEDLQRDATLTDEQKEKQIGTMSLSSASFPINNKEKQAEMMNLSFASFPINNAYRVEAVSQTHYLFWVIATILSVILIAGAILWRQNSGAPTVLSIQDTSVSDDPIDSFEADRLGHMPVAKAIAAFLRNTGTQPPIVLSIEAPWGRGKSSLMNLLRRELAAADVCCVLFNPWHHQMEPVLLAPLLDAIYRKGFPSWLSPAGVSFRFRLLLTRIKRNYRGAGGILLLIGIAFFCLQLIRKVQEPLIDTLKENITSLKLDDAMKHIVPVISKCPDSCILLCVLLASLLAICYLLYRFIQPLPDSPAALLASITGKASLSQIDAQTSFRNRFRKYFREAAEALLPRPLVIFIDDLDRCEPKRTMEIMEAVNFLSSNGPCIFILGMARKVVEANMADALRVTADSLEEVEGRVASPQARLLYARDYLRKLIQLPIAVPQFDSDARKQLLADAARENISAMAKIWRMAGMASRASIMVALIALIGFVYFKVDEWTVPIANSINQRNTIAKSNTGKTAEKITHAELDTHVSPVVEKQPSDGESPLWLYIILALLIIVGGYEWVNKARFHKKDSDDFREALEIWRKLFDNVPDKDTPREYKRFLNIARYAAARFGQAVPELGLLETLLRKFTPHENRPSYEWPNLHTITEEDKIVAMAAVLHATEDEQNMKGYILTDEELLKENELNAKIDSKDKKMEMRNTIQKLRQELNDKRNPKPAVAFTCADIQSFLNAVGGFDPK